ncbi:TIGR02281 family clan AA aspartic protease [Alteromonas sp. 345S023]|uniref:TIGR02281 family clan AA aspartic protease n=1 Tax=Alteromonas profundi TaxID=2696062 RepID=A0A7X5RJS7_9ALTE|nr:TIGR02281 family clan AA aspartic protease [Alteromonas profundi]NDV90167.1 TIGR02281 family clan AA aspartic protease [Alteromonas profundi]
MDKGDVHTGSAGKWMVVLAWVCGLSLLVFVFSDLLEKQVNPNSEPQSKRIGSQTEVRLKQNRQGHYVTSGFINGEEVVFLVDTGATDVAVPAHLATRLNLTPGRQGMASTANGLVRVAESRINTLRIGDIVINNVKANLNPGMQDDHILLGMSVLKQLEFTQRGEWLILRTL